MGQIKFRRIKGRIVPIHVKEGSLDLAAGATVAGVAGAASAALHSAPRIFRKKAKDMLFESLLVAKRQSMYPKGAQGKLLKNSVKFEKFGKIAEKFSRDKFVVPIFLGGAALGGYYISRGINKLLDTKPKDDGPARNVGTAQAGQIAAFTVAGTSFLRSKGVRPISTAAKQALSVLRHYKGL